MDFLEELDLLDDLRGEIESRRGRMLRRAGWINSSEYPDSVWRWSKVLETGRITCDETEALCIESYLRPAEEREKYDSEHDDGE